MTLLEFVFLAVFWAWLLSAILLLRNTLLPRVPVAVSPDAFSLPSETVQFPSSDGVVLEGWKISGKPGRPWIILCHGVGSNRADLLDVAGGLQKAGFNLLLFDFRGHGGSRGWTTSFGWRERRDLEGALAYLGQESDVPARPYGFYGISMGGAVGIMVAAGDDRIGAVAVDSPYPNLEETLGRHMALLYPVVPRIPFLWFALATYRLRFGVWPRHVSPEDRVAALSPRPLLLMHGGDDPRMPLEGSKRLLKRAGPANRGAKGGAGKPTAELWVVEGAGHLEGYAVDARAYRARLVEFFRTSLR